MDPETLSKEQRAAALASLRHFCAETLDSELSEMRAGFLLDYFLKEIAPIAYNQGVEDARRRMQAAVEDLPGSCFQEPFTYWQPKPAMQNPRRKPDK